jgi:hypothetical protein
MNPGVTHDNDKRLALSRRWDAALRLRHPSDRRRRSQATAIVDAQDQPRAFAGPPPERDFRRPVRAGGIGPDLLRAACNVGPLDLIGQTDPPD